MSILADLAATGAPLERIAGPPRMSACPHAGSVDRALWAGLHADRLGYAFMGGYASALSRLFAHAGAAAPEGTLSLAATESGGAHPRAIATTLREENGTLVLRGEKTFATLASVADAMLVVASRGEDAAGKKDLAVVRVPRAARGVTIEERPPTPFAPEIPHAVVRLADVAVAPDAVLPGDGYEAWLKPFRTIEDTHVLAATIGYLAGVARTYGFERNVLAELVAHAASLVDLGARPPSAPVTHVVLAGVFSSARKLVASLDGEWKRASDDERERWARDLPLLIVAENARTKRTESAFLALAKG